MALTTLTKREQEWRKRARRAVENAEDWERCPECLRFHPANYEGPCDDSANRLPVKPSELLE